VYKGDAVPATDEAKIEQMWFWLNKSSDPNDPRLGIVDVENFNRPADEPKGKGGVIWSAKLTERPRFEMDRYFVGGDRQRARMGQAATISFRSGFMSISISQNNTNGYNSSNYNTQYDSDDDEKYFRHSYFNDSRRHEQFRHESYEDQHCLSQAVGYKKERAVGPKVMTKWKLNTQAIITPGTTGRKDHYILEVFSKGTAITTWMETVSVHERTVGGPDNERKEKYVKRETKGSDAKFVDRIEFCLKSGDEVKATWVIIGDSSEERCSATQITDDTPLYTAVTNGGFWKRSSLTVSTQGPVDGALALLVAQLAASEYSINELKSDLNLHTSSNFPRSESELHSRFQQ